MAQTDHAGNFRRLLVQACVDLEVVRAAASGSLALVKVDGPNRGQIHQELTNKAIDVFGKTALFNSIRAGRILEHAADEVCVDREKRKKILNLLKPVRNVRDANEHAFDAVGRKVELSLSYHPELDASLDQISVYVAGLEHIMIGNVNLVELYKGLVALLDELNRVEGGDGWVSVI